MNRKSERKQVVSFRLSDRHKQLLEVSAYANGCSKTKVLEDALNKYYRLNKGNISIHI
jgi:hypothetical protein